MDKSPNSGNLLLEEKTKELQGIANSVYTEVERVVVGLQSIVELILVSIISRGHVLVEGVPGIAKTTLLKTIAKVLGCEFNRIQFTPDLLPSDITGTYILNRKSGEFDLKRGPIFSQIVLADEINRAPAKTQAALLEAMQEYQVTIEGNSFALRQPFIIFATQNPVEQEGVYRLPEAQLDRFFFRVVFNYLPPEQEKRIYALHSKAPLEPKAVLDSSIIVEIQERVKDVFVKDAILDYVVRMMAESRKHPDIELGGSPRAGLCLVQAARAQAFLRGRTYVTHDDVKIMSGPVLNHRLILKPEAEIEGRTAADVVKDILQKTQTFQD